MITMVFLLINLMFNILFASFEGIREAIFYDVNVSSKTPYTKNAHPLFVELRSCFWALTFLFAFVVKHYIGDINVNMSLLYSAGILLSEFMVFSFFHDGFYYKRRNQLNSSVYPKGFTDASTTSTAKIELSFNQRVLLFVAGLILYSVCLC